MTRAVAAELRVGATRHNLTQKEIAAASDIPLATLGKIFRGVAPIDIEQLAQICASIGVDPKSIVEAAQQHLAASEAPIASVIEGRFRQMGSGRDFSDLAVAQHSEVSIFDEQDRSGETP